ncbi:MAG: hypothetical protein WD294_02265 [Phycisphaeraceae bacterium]
MAKKYPSSKDAARIQSTQKKAGQPTGKKSFPARVQGAADKGSKGGGKR